MQKSTFYTLPSCYIHIYALRGYRVRCLRPNSYLIKLLLYSLARYYYLASSLLVTLISKAIINFYKGVTKVSKARITSNRIFDARFTSIDRAYITSDARVYIISNARAYISRVYIARARLLSIIITRFASRSIYVFFIFYLLKISLEILPSLLYLVS